MEYAKRLKRNMRKLAVIYYCLIVRWETESELKKRTKEEGKYKRFFAGVIKNWFLEVSKVKKEWKSVVFWRDDVGKKEKEAVEKYDYA